MKTKIIIFSFFLIFQNIFSQEITGTWYGGIDIQGQKLPLVVHIQKEENSYKSTFDSPLQGAEGIPIPTTTFINNILTLEVPSINFVYKGNYNDGKFDGTLVQNGMSFPLILTRNNTSEVIKRPQTPEAAFNYDHQDISIKNEIEGNILAGTLASPKNFDKNDPILIMITGSGAQNRDEELFGHKPFLVIADDLAKKRIATLRLDDRGIGGSEKGKEGATTLDFATDINSAVNYLVKDGYKNIGLIGHSEGGMIAPMVANKNKNVKFIILLAGPGIPIEDLMIQQSNDISKISGADEKTIKTNEQLNLKIYSFVNNYKGKDLKIDLKALIISDLRKFPTDQIPSEQIEKVAENQANQISNPWFLYFFKFNPDENLSKIKIPVLALNGSLDLQVSSKENLAGIEKSLTKAGNKNFEIQELEGLNHLFQTTATGNPSEYGQIEETFSPKALQIISAWILKLK